MVEYSKFEAFADDKITVAQGMISFFDWPENIDGKGEMLVTSIFSFSRFVLQRVSSHSGMVW